MVSQYFSVEWSDLDIESQERIIDSCVESLVERSEEEGKEFLSREWHEPKPKTWQEAFVRYNSIDHILWEDYEKSGNDEPRWNQILYDHLREQAEDACYKAFHNFEMEVEL